MCQYLLLSRGADSRTVDSDGHFPLYWAAYSGHLDIVQYFCDEVRGGAPRRYPPSRQWWHIAPPRGTPPRACSGRPMADPTHRSTLQTSSVECHSWVYDATGVASRTKWGGGSTARDPGVGPHRRHHPWYTAIIFIGNPRRRTVGVGVTPSPLERPPRDPGIDRRLCRNTTDTARVAS